MSLPSSLSIFSEFELNPTSRSFPPFLRWPVHMSVDYVRVVSSLSHQGSKLSTLKLITFVPLSDQYQPQSSPIAIGCDPVDRPTKSYIENHPDLYANPNFTSFGLLPGGAGETFPGNSLLVRVAVSPSLPRSPLRVFRIRVD